MTKEEMKRLHLTPIENLITEDYGKEGTSSRAAFEAKVDEFISLQKSK